MLRSSRTRKPNFLRNRFKRHVVGLRGGCEITFARAQESSLACEIFW